MGRGREKGGKGEEKGGKGIEGCLDEAGERGGQVVDFGELIR